MGTSYSRGETPPPPTAGETPPSGARVHLAPAVTAKLIEVLQESVIRGAAHHASEERECYEVARDLRGAGGAFRRAIRDMVPGGVMSSWPRMCLVDKIIMVFTDTVSLVLIRPGPTPEDRQACDLVQEAADMEPMLTDLIGQVIAVDDRAHDLADDESNPLWGSM